MTEVTEIGQELALVSPSDIVFCDPGDDAVLSCHLKPAISAVSMEIKWWNKTDLVCHYKNRQVTVSRHYEDRASFSLQELNTGNVSLTIRDVRRSQRGIYICAVTHGCQTIKEYIFLHICSQDVKLVVPTGPVCTDSGSDVILPAHLLPETNAVSMDIRWFKGTELIYQYKNGQDMTNNDRLTMNRVSLSTQELRRGNLTLCLSNVNQSDSGDYTCKLIHNQYQKTQVIHLQVRELQKHEHTHKSKHQADELTFQKTPNYGGTYTEERNIMWKERVVIKTQDEQEKGIL
ncbi:butyrophilin subfamily 3 member A2-like [Labeo rohita]|uniref:butyrophilin subfamily 3 member A2-like n=1 Tax=Labeo rohita TaxID=84645 RepID=UPI0021E27441|nr:butyrophilin subfamily 3 member A2-like [Labeo rohita]